MTPRIDQEDSCDNRMLRSVVSSPLSQYSVRNVQIKSDVEEGTDLDNSEIEEHIHMFTPPHSPLVKLAYFSQQK